MEAKNMTTPKRPGTKPEGAQTIVTEIEELLAGIEGPLSLNTKKPHSLLMQNQELRPYVDFFSKSRADQDAALEKIKQLPFELRYTPRISRAIQQAFADFDWTIVGIDMLAGLSEDDIAGLFDPDVPAQFSLFLIAL